eukprot:GEMP01107405.1.p2 GENE.GEMP01107405.1~~GEMP01107405.1.p2  ORF type:complete len:100 (-),score=11.66 GEMP01107405.1:189-488(-)
MTNPALSLSHFWCVDKTFVPPPTWRSSTYKSNAFPSENKSSRASNNKYACQSVHVGTLRKGPTVPVIVRACVWVLLSGAANDDRHRVSSATSPFLQIRK